MLQKKQPGKFSALKWESIVTRSYVRGGCLKIIEIKQAFLWKPFKMEWRILDICDEVGLKSGCCWEVGRWNRATDQFMYSVSKYSVMSAKSWATKDAKAVLAEIYGQKPPKDRTAITKEVVENKT